MGRRGPVPATTEEKLLRGETRPSRVNYDEPKLDPPKSLAPPKDLKGPGLGEWKRQVADLSTRGVLTTADMTAFERYCRAYSRLRYYEQLAEKAGPTAVAQGFEGAAIKWGAQVNTLARECGLTPSSRSAVKARTGQKKQSVVRDFRLAKGARP